MKELLQLRVVSVAIPLIVHVSIALNSDPISYADEYKAISSSSKSTLTKLVPKLQTCGSPGTNIFTIGFEVTYKLLKQCVIY